MISFEKVKKSLRTSTLVIAIFNIIFAVFGLFGLFGLFISKQALDSGNTDALGLTAEQIQLLEASVTPLIFAITILGILVNILLVVYCFINLSKIKKEQAASPLPYYISIAWATISFFINFFSSVNMTTIFVQLVVQALFIFLSFYALQQVNRLAGKDETAL